ncbi:hypothetical protein WDW37_12660 [Bdellovibrionota bacterium FG-1]
MSTQMNTKKNIPTSQVSAETKEETPIPVDGFRQILEMLRIADPDFRESLLRRLGSRDRELARQLRDDLDL